MVSETGDPTTVELPALPDGWTVTTRQENHLAVLHTAGGCEQDGHKRSVAVMPTGGQASGWTAMGVAGYGPTCPRLARNEPLSEAIAAAVEEMKAVNAGEPSTSHADDVDGELPSPAGRDGAISAGAGSANGQSDHQQGDDDGDEGGGGGQASLDEWASG